MFFGDSNDEANDSTGDLVSSLVDGMVSSLFVTTPTSSSSPPLQKPTTPSTPSTARSDGASSSSGSLKLPRHRIQSELEINVAAASSGMLAAQDNEQAPPSFEGWAFESRPDLELRNLALVRSLGKGQYGYVALCRHRQEHEDPLSDEALRTGGQPTPSETPVAPAKGQTKKKKRFSGLLGGGLFQTRAAVDETVTLRKGQEYFALKIMARDRFCKPKHERMLMNERTVLASLNHPFHIKLINAYRSDHSLCIMTEFVEGGTMLERIHSLSVSKKKKKRLSTDEIRFYVANILSAVRYMHKRNIIHRDLKMSNYLIASNGYLRLCDYGFAKELHVGDKTKTFVGTYSSLSPEQCRREPYDHSVDLWAMGITIFEMAFMFSPFGVTDAGDDFGKKVMNNILTSPVPMPWTMDVSVSVKSFIEGLLTKDRSQRLGSDLNYSRMLRMELLQVVDWPAIESQSVRAPWIPPPP